MVRKLVSVLVVAAAAGLILSPTVWAAGSGTKGSATKPQKAAAFTLEDPDGNKVSLSDFADKIVVLYWVNWDCPFDKRHHTAGTLKTLAGKYKDKGVVFLGINSTKYQTKADNKKMIAHYGLPYTVLDDHPGDVGHAYKARTSPDIRIIDKKQTIVYSGGLDNDPRGKRRDDLVNYVEQALDELLAGKAVSVPVTKPWGCTVKYAK